MDVRCSRCQTEYELDDALVSDRGTMVKCTSCGLQFRVQPPRGQAGSNERWIVRRVDGTEQKYLALSELQRAIANGQVHSDDLLSRDNQAFRALDSIAELEPFFAAAQGRQSAPPHEVSAQASPAKPVQPRTLMGISPTAAGATPVAAKPQGSTLLGVADTVPVPHDESAADDELPTSPFAALQDELPTRPVNALPPGSLPGLVGAVAVREAGDASSGLNVQVAAFPVSMAPPHSLPGAPRAARLRWVMALVVLGGIGLLAGTMGRKYLEGLNPQVTVSPSADSQRTATMLQQGEQLFYQGDLEGAKAQFDKATALSELDPVALAFLARVESVRADTSWLKLRLLPKDNAERGLAEQELVERLGKLKLAVAAAQRAAGNHPAVIRAELDALRIDGNLKEARELAPKLAAAAAEPETDYVLGALDMADESPSWPSVIERLRTASAVERGLGRARALLVFALIRADRTDDAKLELGKLASEPPPHPLLPLLRSFVGSNSAEPNVDLPDEAAPPLPSASAQPNAPSSGAPPVISSNDPRVLLSRAAAARRAGDLEQAEQYYQMTLAKSPGNVEAEGALGEIAMQKGDLAVAQRHFESALSTNPHYLPALVGLADIKWNQGQRAQAAELYQRVIDRAGTSTSYGARAAARLAEMGKKPPEVEGAPTSDPVAPQTSAPTPAPAPTATATQPVPAQPVPAQPVPTAAPTQQAPQIDTSDLPERPK